MPKWNRAIISLPLLGLIFACSQSHSRIMRNDSPPSFLIVGGQYAAEFQFPYQVLLQNMRTVQHFGGSIISAKYVVTAAHCVVDKDEYIYPASVFLMRAGSTKFHTGGVVRRIKQIIVHRLYSIPDNDIALMRLSRPLSFSKSIQPIALASSDPPVGAMITVSGWGRVCHGCPAAMHLKFNNLNSISRAECQQYDGYLPQSVFCLSHPPGNGACNGDSGGPAVYNHTLVGIVSFVLGHLPSCGTKLPEAFTSVALFRKWLLKNSDVEDVERKDEQVEYLANYY